jgi:GT2 family glycosyltransferase
MARPRVLLAVTVYNGWAFVPRCLRSGKELSTESADIEVLALDDASPEPGFSEKLAEVCRELGVHYYRTPRNLGIVRNVNLGLLAAVEGGFDYVIISNSDVIYSRRMVDEMLATAHSDPRIGSVTAWSNNVSIYSIPNVNPDQFLASQETVDWVSASLSGVYRGSAVDIPAGISFAILMPTSSVRKVGLMDPVFGRGYCEETDWSLRSLALGYRLVLAPAAFVYHQGRGSTIAAGMVSGGHTTVPANEAIIDFRYPLFREQVDGFIKSGILNKLHEDSCARIIRDAGQQFGYDIQFGALQPKASSNRVKVAWTVKRGKPQVQATFLGFVCDIPSSASEPYDSIRAFFTAPPVAMGGDRPLDLDPGATASAPLRPTYPARV